MAYTGRKHKPDYGLLLIILLLIVLGLIVIYSISPALSYRLIGQSNENYFLYRQLIHIFVALAGFTVASLLPIQFWKKILPFLIIATVISTLLLLIPGISITQNGATRWIGSGNFSFQPAELLKLTLVLYLAFVLGKRRLEEINDPATTVWPISFLLLLVAIAVVFIQKDMGTMLVMVAIVLGMLYLAGLELRQMAAITGSLAGLMLLAIIMFPHRIARLLTFLNPQGDVQGAGYHINQALIAVGSGGILGVGLGRSIQAYGYLPEAANDSIFAIFAEKFGFIGTVFILILFTILTYKIFKVAQKTDDNVIRLLVSGVGLWFASHIVINIGAMLALLPLTGITLPFLSYGGSSLLLMMIALGIVFKASKQTSLSSSSVTSNKFNPRRKSGVVTSRRFKGA